MKYIDKERIEKISRLIWSSRSIVIVSHVNPDGDAVGALTGMGHFCKYHGLICKMLLPNRYPDTLSFLDHNNEILIHTEHTEESIQVLREADLIIALDFNNLKRVDRLAPHIKDSSAIKVLIDHHPDPEEIEFDQVLSTAEISSTSELLYWILKEISEERGCAISVAIAQSLYAGMMTDTNNFNNSTTSSTFTMAAEIAKMGIDRDYLQKELFGSFSESRVKLIGYALNTKLTLLSEYKAAYIVLSKKELGQFNFKDGDTEGLVNWGLNIKGVEISALFTETDECVRVSLRSSGEFSVNRLSNLYFNGGGHERAAGGRLAIPIEQVAEYFRLKLAEFLDSYSGCS